MYRLYGSCHHSPLHIIDRLRAWKEAGGHKIKFSIYQRGRTFAALGRPHLVVFSTFQDFKSGAEALYGKPIVALVCDAAPLLAEVQGLKFLDAKIPKGMEYRFSLRDLDEQRLTSALTAIKETRIKGSDFKPCKFKVEKINLLPRLVKLHKSGSLTTHLNAIILNVSHEVRTPIRRAFANHFLTGTSHEKMKKDVLKNLRGAGIKKAFGELESFLKSDKGKAYVKAFAYLNGSKDKKGRSTPYDKAAKKFGVEAYDLKYVVTLGRQGQHHSSNYSMDTAVEKLGAESRAKKKLKKEEKDG